MKFRRLLLLVGLGVIGAIAIRAQTDRPGTEIAIEDRGDARLPEGHGGDPDDLESIEGVGPAYAERLRAAGVDDVADLAAADVTAIAEATGIGAARIRGWQEQLASQ